MLVSLMLVAIVGGVSASATAATSTSTTHHSSIWRLEHLALSLLNCTRTGGWVHADGQCAGGDSGKHSHYRKPLALSTAISDRVSRPYAKRMLAAHACSHYVGGSSIPQRFRSNGYKGSPYGESIGCGDGWTPRQMIIHASLSYQSEKGTSGWHWRNLKNPGFDRVGIGVAVGRNGSRVVYDFYGG
jgi:hypothetical protein